MFANKVTVAVCAFLAVAAPVATAIDVDCHKNVCELDDAVSCPIGCEQFKCSFGANNGEDLCAPIGTLQTDACAMKNLEDCIVEPNGNSDLTNADCMIATCELDDDDDFRCPIGCKQISCKSGENRGDVLCAPKNTTDGDACSVRDPIDCIVYHSETNCYNTICELDDDDGFVCPQGCAQSSCPDDDDEDDVLCHPKNVTKNEACAARDPVDCTIAQNEAQEGIDCKTSFCNLESGNRFGHCPSVCGGTVCPNNTNNPGKSVCHPLNADQSLVMSTCNLMTEETECGAFTFAQGASTGGNNNNAGITQPASALVALALTIIAAAF